MTAWLRRKDLPVQPLAEDRKRLVHSYMDADEETARRQAIEERERQSQERALVRSVPSKDRPRPDADSAGNTQGKAAGESELGPDDFADLVRREAAKQAARQVAVVEGQARRLAAEEVARQVAAAEEQARRAADEQAELRIAAAVEEARQEVSREAAEETARQVAAAEERARRLAVEAAAQQIAAAEERARAAAAVETVRLVVSAEERARAEVAEEAAQQIAAAEERVRAAAAEETLRQVALAEERARTAAAEQAARQTAAAEELARAEAVAATARQPAATARLEHPHNASAVSVSGEELQDPAESRPEEISPAARDLAREDSAEGLPVYEWIHAATRSDGAGDAPDWTRDLLRIRDKTQTDRTD